LGDNIRYTETAENTTEEDLNKPNPFDSSATTTDSKESATDGDESGDDALSYFEKLANEG